MRRVLTYAVVYGIAGASLGVLVAIYTRPAGDSEGKTFPPSGFINLAAGTQPQSNGRVRQADKVAADEPKTTAEVTESE